jgi:hypothetical protein
MRDERRSDTCDGEREGDQEAQATALSPPALLIRTLDTSTIPGTA